MAADGTVRIPHIANLPLLQNENDVDVNGNVIPDAQIIRREPDNDAFTNCTHTSKVRLTTVMCILQLITSFTFAWLYLSSTDASAPKTFAWKQINTFFYKTVKNNSKDCRHFTKSIPVPMASGIRPRLNPKDFCVLDKSVNICAYELEDPEWYWIPTIPLLTFILPILVVVLTSVYVCGRPYLQNDTLAKIACPVYILCFINPVLFLFGWTKQFLQYVVSESIKDQMYHGYDLMTAPHNISVQWEISQINNAVGFTLDGIGTPLPDYIQYLAVIRAPPQAHQVWNKGCYTEERNGFAFTAGITVLLVLGKTILEFILVCLLVDSRPRELVETSMIHCTHFVARAYGTMEIVSVLTDNRIQVTIHNFRPGQYAVVVQRRITYAELTVRSRNIIRGSVRVLPADVLTVEDILIHHDQAHRGIYEITTRENVTTNEQQLT